MFASGTALSTSKSTNYQVQQAANKDEYWGEAQFTTGLISCSKIRAWRRPVLFMNGVLCWLLSLSFMIHDATTKAEHVGISFFFFFFKWFCK